MIFSGTAVFLSKKLLPLDVIASLQDVLVQNGAQVHHCCNPERNAPNEFHVIFPDWEMYDSMRKKNCQVVSPQCIFRCAQDQKRLPNEYSCCSGMERIQVVATGFNAEEMANIKAFVTSMGGKLEGRTSASTNFVISKTVLTSDYKKARQMGKPVVTLKWLMHCCREHRIVSHEEHRLPCFTGLKMCATGIPLEERNKMCEAVELNGGSFVPDLTRNCTHLIAEISFRLGFRLFNVLILSLSINYSPEGNKYLAAIKWRNIKVVNKQWLWESILSKTRLDESEYPVTSASNEDVQLVNEPEPVKQPEPEPGPDPEPVLECEAQMDYDKDQQLFDQLIDEGLYLANCRCYIVGFDKSEMKGLVDMVLDGGGTRYIELNKTITHVIMGRPSESELKDVEQATMWGSIQVVNSTWLEECRQQKQEILVTTKYIPARPFRAYPKAARSQSLSALRDDKTNTNKPATPETTAIVGVFSDITFTFLDSFPIAKRSQVSEWITKAGGCVQDESTSHFLIGNHGSTNLRANNVVSTQWIKGCTLENKLLDVNGHIIYRPLSCQIPLPGFEKFRICISQFSDSEVKLFRNLCYFLGAEFKTVLNSKVTHLICQVAYGKKYEAALSKGIRVATMEWINACAIQNAVVAIEDYHPPVAATPSQAAGLVTGELSSPWTTPKSQTETPEKRKKSKPDALSVPNKRGKNSPVQPDIDAWDEFAVSWPSKNSKPDNGKVDTRSEEHQRPAENMWEQHPEELRLEQHPEEIMLEQHPEENMREQHPEENNPDESNPEASLTNEASSSMQEVEVGEQIKHQPDVAAAIESLLAHTNKGKDEVSQVKQHDEQREVLAKAAAASNFLQPSPTSSSHRAQGDESKITNGIPSDQELQFVESQVYSQIGYDEDHTERRYIMERVRTGNISRQKTHTGFLGRLFKAAEANK